MSASTFVGFVAPLALLFGCAGVAGMAILMIRAGRVVARQADPLAEPNEVDARHATATAHSGVAYAPPGRASQRLPG